MKNLRLNDILRVTGGQYFGPRPVPEREIRFITTDSREAGEDCLFAALLGERTDGHNYIESAYEKGALAVLCERRPQREDIPSVVVPSTAAALSEIAAYYRRQYNIPVVGVTGSVGKTTAKEVIASVLSRRFRVHKTGGNFNNELGVPLTLFGLRPEHEAAVIEMGISHFGEMRRLASVVRPGMAVFTVIGHSHLEYLHNREGVLRAKSELLEGMPADGVVFVNGDDDLLRSAGLSLRTVRFGLGANCDVRAESIQTAEGGEATAFQIVKGERRFAVRVPAYGSHMVYAALAGAAVGLELGMTEEEIAAGLAEYETVGRRARIVRTECCTLVDDCYNANPDSCAAAIRSLAALPGRKVCILGDMLELGEASPSLHRALGALAAASGVRVVITCGSEAGCIFEGAREAKEHVLAWHFEEKEPLIESLCMFLQKGDAVLVKASHGMHFEQISEAIEKLRDIEG
jgi:UDP-N-acetylmuramoyl-tripeptide--D-alanyl-D-alanine ligase